jgi:hypothetical protein
MTQAQTEIHRRAQIKWIGATGQEYTITVDASIHETHKASSTVTDHPVEIGSNVADHIRPDPDELSMECVISNHPSFLPRDHMGGVVQQAVQIKGAQKTAADEVNKVPLAGGAIGLVASTLPVPTSALGQIGIGKYDVGIVQGWSGEFDRVTECYQELLKIRRTGQLVRILTTLRSYDNMAMLVCDVDRVAASGASMDLALEFKNVRFGQTKNEPVPKIAVAPKPKAKAEKKEETDDDDDKSFLFRKLNPNTE